MSWYRDIFTGELVEREYQEPGVIARTSVPESAVDVRRRTGSPWYKENLCKALSVKPEEATPERVARENEDAKRRGTGAKYDKEGRCWLPSRRSRNLEMRRLGRQDNDGGYGDWAGR